MSPRGLASALALIACACFHAPAQAGNRALLVGVSAYPTLDSRLQLVGPADDVRGMRDALRQRGFEAAAIELLADGVDGAAGLPTRAAILAGLARLARDAQAGDTVVLMMSGHGSQQPAPASAAEPDGWSEVFLPRDVGRWNGLRGEIDNALSDVVLRGAIDRIGDRGAFVWAIFDACHAGTLVRGDNTNPGRHVAPAELGIARQTPPTMPNAVPRLESPRLGRAAYFYASQSGESVRAMRLPRGAADARIRGLLSFTIAQAIGSGRPMTYRQLAQYVLAEHASHGAHMTPLFSGNGLDEPVFGQRSAIVRQWLLETAPGRPMTISAGSLDGLAPGARFVVLDPLSSPFDAGARELRAVRVEAGQSTLEDVSAVAGPGALSGGHVRLIESPPSLALTVAADTTACRGCTAGTAIERLKARPMAGVDLRWVNLTDSPDLVLTATASHLRYQIGNEPGSEPLGLATARDAGPDDVARRAAIDLHALSRARNLLAFAAVLATRSANAPLDSALLVDRHGAQKPIDASQAITVRSGDGLVLRVANPNDVSIDFTLLLIDSRRGVTVRYPLGPGESNRLEQQAFVRIADMTVDASTTGTEWLLLIWTPARKHHERRDFSMLQQSPLERVRGGNDGDDDPAVQALYDACFAEHLTRGSDGPAPLDRLGMRLYTLRVLP